MEPLFQRLRAILLSPTRLVKRMRSKYSKSGKTYFREELKRFLASPMEISLSSAKNFSTRRSASFILSS